MKLYLMRHGQAANPQIDPEQGLTRVGRTNIEQLAQRLAGQGVQFMRVYHSEKTRARQTAEIMVDVIAPEVVPEERAGLKPNDNPADLLPVINAWQEDTLITSHLPFVPGLLALLTGQSEAIDFVPGTVVCLVRNENATWQIEWVASP